jgi:hypothetical protein
MILSYAVCNICIPVYMVKHITDATGFHMYNADEYNTYQAYE